MLFKKLFGLLVVSGAMMGAGSGCAARAADDKGSASKKGGRDAGPAADAGTPKKAEDTGGGAPGW